MDRTCQGLVGAALSQLPGSHRPLEPLGSGAPQVGGRGARHAYSPSGERGPADTVNRHFSWAMRISGSRPPYRRLLACGRDRTITRLVVAPAKVGGEPVLLRAKCLLDVLRQQNQV